MIQRGADRNRVRHGPDRMVRCEPDDKMIHYFSRLGLPEELALVFLYGVAVIEVEAPVIRKEVVVQHFREFDVDADGRISSVEFDAYIDRVAEGVEAV